MENVMVKKDKVEQWFMNIENNNRIFVIQSENINGNKIYSAVTEASEIIWFTEEDKEKHMRKINYYNSYMETYMKLFFKNSSSTGDSKYLELVKKCEETKGNKTVKKENEYTEKEALNLIKEALNQRFAPNYNEDFKIFKQNSSYLLLYEKGVHIISNKEKEYFENIYKKLKNYFPVVLKQSTYYKADDCIKRQMFYGALNFKISNLSKKNIDGVVWNIKNL